MSKNYNILAISGSLRKASFNTLTVKAYQKLAPEGIAIELADISQIPLYNEDLRSDGDPESVNTLVEQIAKADGVLFVTPEYNYAIPGVLKNTIDWISRSPQKPFNFKPVVISGASPGMLGTARAQYNLRQILVFLNVFTLNTPEVFISSVQNKFDTEGNLIDDNTAQVIVKQLNAFIDLIERVKV